MDITFLWIDLHHILVSENENIKSWSFETEEVTDLQSHGSKRRSMRNRLSLTTSGSIQFGTSPISPSPRNMTGLARMSYERDIQNDLDDVEKEREEERKAKKMERKQQLKYNGVDIESPHTSRMNEDDMIQYAMHLSREGSFQTSSSWNDLNAARIMESGIEGLSRDSLESVPSVRVNGLPAAQSIDNEFDLEIQLALALSLSMEEG
jgi:hypothetical protein